MQRIEYITTEKEKTNALLLNRPGTLDELNGEWYFKIDPEEIGEREQWYIPY